MSSSVFATLDNSKLGLKLCYPFVEALVNTLKVQCSVPVTFGHPSLRMGDSKVPFDLALSISIVNPDTLALVTICFPNEVFLGVLGKMFGETYETITPELEDAGKEIINMVFNQSKKVLVAKGISGIRAIPAVYFGKNLRFQHMSKGVVVEIPLFSEWGPFHMEITTQEVSVSDKV